MAHGHDVVCNSQLGRWGTAKHEKYKFLRVCRFLRLPLRRRLSVVLRTRIHLAWGEVYEGEIGKSELWAKLVFHVR